MVGEAEMARKGSGSALWVLGGIVLTIALVPREVWIGLGVIVTCPH